MHIFSQNFCEYRAMYSWVGFLSTARDYLFHPFYHFFFIWFFKFNCKRWRISKRKKNEMRSLEFDFRNFPWYKLRGKRKCGITNKYFLASPLSAPFWLEKKQCLRIHKPKIYMYIWYIKEWPKVEVLFFIWTEGFCFSGRQAGKTTYFISIGTFW